LKLTFDGSTKASLWDEELVTRMRKYGLIRISFGLKTADTEVTEIIKKGVV